MTLLEACEIATRMLKENKEGKITEIWENNEAYAFLSGNYAPMQCRPVWISKNGSFEPKFASHLFRLDFDDDFRYDVEIPKQYI